MTFTDEQVTAAIRSAVEIKGGDYTYVFPADNDGECAYSTPDAAPSCIVGFVVNKLDSELFFSLHDLEWTEKDDGSPEFFESMAVPLPATSDGEGVTPKMKFPLLRFREDFTDAQLRALATAQAAQDSGKPWSVARMEFEQKLNANG